MIWPSGNRVTGFIYLASSTPLHLPNLSYDWTPKTTSNFGYLKFDRWVSYFVVFLFQCYSLPNPFWFLCFLKSLYYITHTSSSTKSHPLVQSLHPGYSYDRMFRIILKIKVKKLNFQRKYWKELDVNAICCMESCACSYSIYILKALK